MTCRTASSSFVNKAEEPDGIWVSTVWTSRDAHDATLQRDDVRAAISDATRFLSDTPPQQIFLTPVGGKGLPKG